MTTHLGLQRILLPSAQVSSLTTGSITLPSARGAFAETDFQSIATVTVGSGGASSVDFTSILGTYVALQIRYVARAIRTGENADLITFRFNGDTASNYSWHALEGNGSTAFTELATGSSMPRLSEISATTATANIFGAGVVDILDYASSSIFKTVRSLGGVDRNGSGTIWFGSSNWRDTSAITSINIIPTVGTGFAEYSSFALYGIKGA